MSFSYDGSGLPYLSNHAEALRFWEQAGKWRGESNERILDKRAKRNVTIRQTSDGSIACKLHATDVVVYRANNTLTIRPWMSMSTDAFAGRLLGRTTIQPSFNQGVVRIGGVFYRANNTLELAQRDGSYVLTSTPDPFVFRTINRKKANVVLKAHDYKAFADWVRTVAVAEVEFELYRGTPTTQGVGALLADRQQWERLLVLSYHWSNKGKIQVDQTITNVRETLYRKNPQVYDVVTVPHVATWDDVRRWKRSRRISQIP